METRLETPEYFKRAMLYREGEEVFGYRLMQTTVCALAAPSSSLSSSSAASGTDASFAREHLLLLPACTSHWLELVEDSQSLRSSRVFAFSAAWGFVCFRSFL
ncbi:unnamed protein product [Sphagnum troendelagicum]|uniref:Uncharacterized protein n=1 Tax=Sphagnum troendelagicum TaxID=128251 RepID=A0ABP0TI73_9BRYO